MKQYHELLKSILAHGTAHEDRTGVGTISHFGYQTRFNLRAGFPIVTTKKIPFRWIAEETFWFLSGDTNEANLRARGVDIWAEWADEEHTSRFGRAAGDLGPVYGYLWRSFGGNYHIYRNHLTQVEELLAREPLELPRLEIIDEDKQLRGLEGLLAMRYENLNLLGYKSHGKIAAPVAV